MGYEQVMGVEPHEQDPGRPCVFSTLEDTVYKPGARLSPRHICQTLILDSQSLHVLCMNHLVRKRRGPGLRGKGWKLGFPQYSQFMNVTLNHANILHNYIKLFIIV